MAGLQELAGAAREARDVAQMYPVSRLLTEKDATTDAVLAALATADVLHFGGHAVVTASIRN